MRVQWNDCKSAALGDISERPDMCLSNALLELHGIDVVVNNTHDTHEIISCSGSTPKPIARLAYRTGG